MRSDRSELANTFRVGAAGLPGEEASPNAQDVATFDLARQFDASKLAEFGERLGNRSGLGRRLSVPSGKIIANSSRTIAGSSTNIESGSWGSAGSEMTRAPKFSSSRW